MINSINITNRRIAFIAISLIMVLLAGMSGYLLGMHQPSTSISQISTKTTSASTPKPTPSSAASAGTRIANYTFPSTSTDPAYEYMQYSIEVPNKYLVTDNDTMEYYLSQGGMGLYPTLLLTTNSQPLAKDQQANFSGSPGRYAETKQSGQDCIAIFNTIGFKSIEDWYQLGSFEYDVTQEQTQKIGPYNITLRHVTDRKTGTPSTQAYFTQPHDVSYFIDTCNANTDQDLHNLIQNLHIRAVDMNQ